MIDNTLMVWTSNTTYERFEDYLRMNAERYCININKLMIESNSKFQEVVVLLLRTFNAKSKIVEVFMKSPQAEIQFEIQFKDMMKLYLQKIQKKSERN